jgi:tetratricopeptide (TPR) repeat protein
MLRSLWRVVQNRPKATGLGLGLVVLVGTLAGLYGYALHQWYAAKEAVKEGRPEEARDRLGWCLAVWPHSPEVHLLAARAARMTGHLEEADSHLKRCIKLQKGATQDTQLEFLLIRVQTGEEDEVRPALQRLIEAKHSESAMILETLARAYMNHLRFGPAYNVLTHWIQVAPDSPLPYHWRGWTLEHLNNHELAMKDYLRALDLDPNLFKVRLRVAEMLLDDKRPLEALPHLERLEREHQGNPNVMVRLGQCRYLQGRPKEARRLLEAAVKDMPRDSALLLHLARLDMDEGRPRQAEQWLRRALKVDPGDTEARYALVSCLQAQGRDDEAAAALARYKKYRDMLKRANRLLKQLAKNPGRDPSSPSEVGTLLLKFGHERIGLYWLHQALNRDPRHGPTHKALADYYEKKGQPEKAAAHRRWLTLPTQKASIQ